MSKQKSSAVKIVVDTNIVFSGILNSSSSIGRILLSPKEHFQFYSCEFLRVEISKHRTKIQKRTKLSAEEVEELELIVTKNISFINDGLIPGKMIAETESLLAEIDLNDTPFVALAKHLKAKLWTGDKELVTGLKAKKFKDVITTGELSALFDKLENS
jgi:predicted nucleic acid-binding protein